MFINIGEKEINKRKREAAQSNFWAHPSVLPRMCFSLQEGNTGHTWAERNYADRKVIGGVRVVG